MPNFNDNQSPRLRTNQQYGGGQNRGSQGSFQQNQEETPMQFFKEANYQSTWITKEANKELVDFAEKMGKYMAKNGLTNSKIRSIYGEIKRIQMGEFEKEKASFYLLRPKVAYAVGREKNNKGNKGSNGLLLFQLVFEKCFENVSDKKSYNNFCNLIEAILAYHKANDGD